jgi:hypothetical protein
MINEMLAQTQSTFNVSYVCLKCSPVTGKFAETGILAIFRGQNFTQIIDLCKNESFSGKQL